MKFKKARWPCNRPPRKRRVPTKKEGRWTKSSYFTQRKGHPIGEWIEDKLMRIEDWAWEKKLRRADRKGNRDEVIFMANLETVFKVWHHRPLSSDEEIPPDLDLPKWSSDEDSPREMALKMEDEIFGPYPTVMGWMKQALNKDGLVVTWSSEEIDVSSDYDSIPFEEWAKPAESYGPSTGWTFEAKEGSPYWTVKKRRKFSL